MGINGMIVSDTIFKGCTRPQMLLGVPMIPMMALVGTFSIGALMSISIKPWAPIVVLMLGVIPYFRLRKLSEKDDQRLHQVWLRYRHLACYFGLLWCLVLPRRRQYYGGLISYSPQAIRVTPFLRSSRADI